METKGNATQNLFLPILKVSISEVIAVDEYKGDAGGKKYQTISADPVHRRLLEIFLDRRKATVKDYLQKYEQHVKMVVMDMSSF